MKITNLKPRVGVLNTLRASVLTTSTQRITGTTLQKTRARILRRDNGLCQCPDCKASPFPRLADIVDHITPLWEGGAEGDDSNLQSMCNDPCHKKKTAEEAKRRAGK